jgi:hypothetical protein
VVEEKIDLLGHVVAKKDPTSVSVSRRSCEPSPQRRLNIPLNTLNTTCNQSRGPFHRVCVGTGRSPSSLLPLFNNLQDVWQRRHLPPSGHVPTSISSLLFPINFHHIPDFQKGNTHPGSRTPVPLKCPKKIHPANGLPTPLAVNNMHRG